MNGSGIELIGLIVAVVAFFAISVGGGVVWMGKVVGPQVRTIRLSQQDDAEVAARQKQLQNRREEVWKRVWVPLVLLFVLGIALVIVGAILQ